MPTNFPPPWSVEDNGSSWAVKDANGFSIVWFVYSHRTFDASGADHMTRSQAYAMAVNFARLPTLLRSATKP